MDNRSWADALLLLDDAYVIVLVGPRSHSDWRNDVIPLMKREARDPRGWETILPEEPERSFESSVYPFKEVGPEEIDAHLYPVNPQSAARLLVAMSCDLGFRVAKMDGFVENREKLLGRAHTLLGRFLPECELYTNSGYARRDPDHDYLREASNVMPYSTLGSDLGLIAVSAEEVGLFWSIDAR